MKFKNLKLPKLLLSKHSKVSVETSRDDSLKEITAKFNKRECQLAAGIEALQTRYCKFLSNLF